MLESDFLKTVTTRAGVYQFYVYSLGKYYIGESVNIRRRVAEHLNGNGKQAIHSAVKQNGLDNIGFQVLGFEEDRLKRISLEQHYKCFYGFDNLLNSISTKDNGSTTKPVLAFSKDGKFYKRFGSISEASGVMDRSPTSISESCKGKSLFIAGYLWLFEENYSETKVQERLLARKERDIKKKQHLIKLSSKNLEKNQKPVVGQNALEDLVFMSITDAANYFNTSVSNISACCLGKQKRIKNYEWSFINE